eukprot:2899775-Pyramimonas_sp.AAC.1
MGPEMPTSKASACPTVSFHNTRDRNDHTAGRRVGGLSPRRPCGPSSGGRSSFGPRHIPPFSAGGPSNPAAAAQ